MKTIIPYLLSAVLIFAGGCSISSDLVVADGESSGSLHTVDGNINVGERSEISVAKTVDGDISIGLQSRTRNLATVDGNITIAEGVSVRGSVKTVDGNIRIAADSEVTGDLRTVDGDIELSNCLVKGDVRIVAGSVTLENAEVQGTIEVFGKIGGSEDTTSIEIGEQSKVGEIEVSKDRDQVVLRIHRSAQVGEIRGVEPQYFD